LKAVVILSLVAGSNGYDRSSLGGGVCSASSKSRDFRFVSHSELAPGLEVFRDSGVKHFSEILFDMSKNRMIVGARDTLYKLSLDLRLLEKAEWKADLQSVTLCKAKGQSEEACHNFVKVLAALQNRLFVCATHAFDPKCSWRSLDDIGSVLDWVDGRGKCPYSAEANSTALMTSNGDYYIGSSIDFSNSDHAIFRMSAGDKNGGKFKNLLRTNQFNTLWLSRPNFVGSFETTKFIYFVFRETGMETSDHCGEKVRSRIARVCKEDRGGKVVGKDNWTTFVKATLDCSVAGNGDSPPFRFEHVQSMDYLEEERLVYASFTTAENSIAGSAICSYNLSSIEDAFSSQFLVSSGPDSVWKSKGGDHSAFECKRTMTSQGKTVTSLDYQLVSQRVRPTTDGPLYHETLARYSHLVVDVLVGTKVGDMHMIFVVSRDSATVKKLSFNPASGRACLVEELQPFPPPTSTSAKVIHGLKFNGVTDSLYLATETGVVKVEAERCARFVTSGQCLKAMDPYCGWTGSKCSRKNPNDKSAPWRQNELDCPALDMPVDGGWGDWSNWQRCKLKPEDEDDYVIGDYESRIMTVDDSDVTGVDTCMCRRRGCDSPAPANGGLSCTEAQGGGFGVEVANCTQHGGWTPWSDWSACSNSCDVGRRQRRRVCGNPKPAFGGKSCVGHDEDTELCSDLPPCNSFQQTTATLTLEPPPPRYSDWTEWGPCSAECGKGFRSRQRNCYGDACTCSKEFEECENKKCTDQIDVTDWTPWIKTLDNGTGKAEEQRFRFSYRGSPTIRLNELGNVEREERQCEGGGRCVLKAASEASIAAALGWSGWSKCTRECGGGYQLKVRYCQPGGEEKGCVGITVIRRACNTEPCSGGQWSCWSDWSGCDNRTGRKFRNRSCRSQMVGLHSCENGAGSGDREEQECDDWSECNASGLQSRWFKGRKEVRPCSASGGGLDPSMTPNGERLSVSAVVGACVCGFLAGLGLGGGLVYYYFRFRKHGGHGAPHYLSAKSNNLYVSLPMLDLKHKNFGASSNQSDFDTLRSTSTIRSRAESSIYSAGGGGSGAPGKMGGGGTGGGGDYDTATIKRSRSQSHRNSALLNGAALRADLDSDQLFT